MLRRMPPLTHTFCPCHPDAPPKDLPFARATTPLRTTYSPIPCPTTFSSTMHILCAQTHPSLHPYPCSFNRDTHTSPTLPAPLSTPSCVFVGKPRTKPSLHTLSSFFLGFSHRVLETMYLTLVQYPCGFSPLIHSSTHNEYYYWNYLSFHGVFLEAFLPPHAFSAHATPRPHNAHHAPKYSQPHSFAESLSTP